MPRNRLFAPAVCFSFLCWAAIGTSCTSTTSEDGELAPEATNAIDNNVDSKGKVASLDDVTNAIPAAAQGQDLKEQKRRFLSRLDEAEKNWKF